MKLSNLFRRKPSREVAKDRLKILLISDRVNCSPEILEMIKKDIAEVISRYMKIDTNNMEIQISKAPTRARGRRPLRSTPTSRFWISIKSAKGAICFGDTN